jgi:tetratricopeptide (TPR) repeat protein
VKRLLPVGVFLALGLATGVWLAPSLLALYHLEAGGQALEKAEAFRAAHGAAVNPALDRAVRHFQRAVELRPADAYAHRRLGDAWLLAGNNEYAAESLSRAADIRPHNPLAHIELGYAWDGLGRADEAVAAYERGRYGPALSQAIVNYLKLADWRTAASGGHEAQSILQDRVLALDPGNLPALVRLASIYEGMSEDGAEFARPVREQMKQFPVESVAVSSDPRQAEYLGQTMVALTEDGTWTREILFNVVAYQVWRFA